MKINLLFASCCLAWGTLPAAAVAAGDPVRGKTLFAQCMACHSVDKTRKSGIGPNLAGIVGRPVATLKDFRYSPALIAKKGRWTTVLLDAYVAAPTKVVPGGRMPYAGMRNPTDRESLIAYLATAK